MNAATAERQALTQRRARSRPGLRLERDAQWLAGAVLMFVATTVWWLSQDTRVQDWDNGLHTLLAFGIHDQLAGGNLTGWFTEFNTYPPLVHLVGAIGVFVGGKSPSSVIIASNLVFVPLLAASCYGVGRLAYGPRAGLLAGLVALGTPLFVSQMHVFMIDPPQAAMVAASVWAILASARFERAGIAALAGLTVGFAMLTKETSVIFLTGLFAVVVLRGGYRNWRGLILFLLAAAAISLPWYVYHVDDLSGLVEIHGGELGGPYAQETPPLLSRASLLWYFWSALNYQWFVPLMLFLLVGVGFTIRDCLERFVPENLGPELLVGLVTSWLGITLIRHKDVRFLLPALVFVAVLATAWIVAARPRIRVGAAVVLGVVLVANFVGVSTGIGPTVRVSLPGAHATSMVHARQLTFYSAEGYIRGGPKHDGNILTLMRGLKRAGVQGVTFDAGSTDVSDFTTFGLTVRAIQAGLAPTAVYNPSALGPKDAFMVRHIPQPGDAAPCQRLEDGSGVYVELGDALRPFEMYTLICPGRHPEIYKRTAPLSFETELLLHPEITGAPRATLLNILLALHRSGVTALEFDHASADALFFQPQGLERLAALAQLPIPPGLAPQQLAPDQAFLIRRPIGPTGPRPCARFPDGTGLYVVLGSPIAVHPHYWCPLPGTK